MTELVPMEIYLEYSGPIDFQRKKDLLAHLTGQFEEFGLDLKIRKRCIYVAEELITNAHDYYKKRDLPGEEITLLITQPENHLLELCISNSLLKTDTDEMLVRIEHINREEGEQLKEMLRDSLAEEQNESTGGGIGLITVKLKTGLNYTVEVIEKNSALNILNLKTLINLLV